MIGRRMTDSTVATTSGAFEGISETVTVINPFWRGPEVDPSRIGRLADDHSLGVLWYFFGLNDILIYNVVSEHPLVYGFFLDQFEEVDRANRCQNQDRAKIFQAADVLAIARAAEQQFGGYLEHHYQLNPWRDTAVLPYYSWGGWVPHRDPSDWPKPWRHIDCWSGCTHN